MSRLEHSQNDQGLPLFKVGSLLMPVQPLRENLLHYQLEQQPHTHWHTVTTLFQHNYRLVPQMARWCRQRPKCPSAQSQVVTGSGGCWKERNLTVLFANEKTMCCLWQGWMPCLFSLYELIRSVRVFFFAWYGVTKCVLRWIRVEVFMFPVSVCKILKCQCWWFSSSAAVILWNKTALNNTYHI